MRKITMQIETLFKELLDLIFTLPDGSELLCQTTLCPELLSAQGFSDVDAIIDFLSKREIPIEMFDYDFAFEPAGTHKLNELDSIFQIGGKLSWKPIL